MIFKIKFDSKYFFIMLKQRELILQKQWDSVFFPVSVGNSLFWHEISQFGFFRVWRDYPQLKNVLGLANIVERRIPRLY